MLDEIAKITTISTGDQWTILSYSPLRAEEQRVQRELYPKEEYPFLYPEINRIVKFSRHEGNEMVSTDL